MSRKEGKERRRARRKKQRGTRKSLTPLQKRCTSKTKHKTKQDALAVVAGIEARVVHIEGRGITGPLCAYYCYRCDNWHIGHNRFDQGGRT